MPRGRPRPLVLFAQADPSKWARLLERAGFQTQAVASWDEAEAEVGIHGALTLTSNTSEVARCLGLSVSTLRYKMDTLPRRLEELGLDLGALPRWAPGRT